MIRSNAGPPRGILRSKAGPKRFDHLRRLPARDLRFFVEHFWIVRWRVSEPYVQETLPHPSVHLVVERGRTQIAGVTKGRFTRVIEGEGLVFGVKFKPGAFYPFVKRPITGLRDSSVRFASVFGIGRRALEVAILSAKDDAARIAFAEQVLRKKLPARDEQVARVGRIVDLIRRDREIVKVDDLIARTELGKRALQRLFARYVGVSPKWVIMRYRLHEVIERLAVEKTVDWAQLAAELGYFDQAHFIKEFKAVVGRSPASYARNSD
jgi:AraC-like DNA-binding protein